VIGKRVLRRICGPKSDRVTGGWRKLHNEELRDLCSSPSVIRIIKSRRVRWAEHAARREKMNAYRVLVGRPEGNRPPGKPRNKWMDLVQMGLDELDWIGLAQDLHRCKALVNSVMNLRVP
jgi:hypothetical protein